MIETSPIIVEQPQTRLLFSLMGVKSHFPYKLP